ncbi:DUF4191 domain-containing protein [Microbacterium oryzae]|uniref:DUF4191 family protein n=1 Tax=Microbacterium oryzae TaxID=743009 RepID=A0A6I6E5K6_9MICO|nr:DUF4191 family protein [Microbacterium oryzae]MDN3309534.1 DUF4191 family protein [Microbacterium oryzae]QGU26598.1 DUF4191 family protein [Microbacterium oryzae]
MARSTPTEKRPGFFSQIRSLFTFTREAFPWIGWLLAGIIVLGVLLGVVVGFLLQPQWWGILLWGITGLMVGALAAMMTMTRLSTRAMYRKLDGMPGAAGHVLANMLGRNWRGEDMPVGINPKTQEAVYRAVGRGGIVVVGEGSKGRLTRLMRDERMRAQRVAHGVPVHEYYVGHGDGEVPIDQLAKTVKSLPKAIDRATMAAVLQRVESVSQSIASLPIPKGIDPTKVRSQRPR